MQCYWMTDSLSACNHRALLADYHSALCTSQKKLNITHPAGMWTKCVTFIDASPVVSTKQINLFWQRNKINVTNPKASVFVLHSTKCFSVNISSFSYSVYFAIICVNCIFHFLSMMATAMEGILGCPIYKTSL